MTTGEYQANLFFAAGGWFGAGVLITLALKHRLDFGNFGFQGSSYGWPLAIGIVLAFVAMIFTIVLAGDYDK